MMDKLETLFNKQELLCSNQFQLVEMISTLTKKIEDFMLPDYDEYLDKLQSSQPFSQNTASASNQLNSGFAPNLSSSFTLPLQSNINLPNTVAPKMQTNFPMNPYVNSQFNTNVNNSFQGSSSLPKPFQMVANPAPTVSYPSIPSISQYQAPPMTWDFGNLSLNKEQCGINDLPLNSSLPPKLEEYDAANFSSYMTSYPSALPTMSAPSFVPSTYSTPLPTVSTPSFAPNFSTAGFASTQYSEQKSIPASAVATYSISLPTGSPSVTKTSAFVGSPLSTSFASPKTPLYGIAKVTPTTTTHSYHIPIPETSTIVKSPPIEIPEDEDDDEVQPVEHDPLPDFKPIIPLPDEIDVKTGEESEEVLYQNRVKLFRYVDKEWKERGIGIYKLLKNTETGKVRALMRREMVHKVCANHFLTDDMVLTPMKTSDRAWIYCAADFADEKVQMEQFCIKFKNPEEAGKFVDAFNKYKVLSAKSPSKPAVSPIGAEKARKIIIAPPQMKIGADEKKEETKSVPNAFTFGAKAEPFKSDPIKPGFTFGSKIVADKVETKGETKSAFAGFTGFSLNTLQPNSMTNLFQSKTIPVSDTPKNVDESAPFAAVTNTVDFSSLSSSGNAFSKSKNFKGFDGAGSLVFGSLGSSPKAVVASPVAAILKNVEKKETSEKDKDTSRGDVTLNDSSVTGADEDFIPTQEFSPVVPLPDLVEVKTGEEGLEVLYNERCKLFRYTGEEWKERGVGVMKILHDPKDGCVRLLMRRDQVHKLCCNQRITKDHELKPHSMSDKAWTWCAQDFSEGELRNETMCIRFKTSEQV